MWEAAWDELEALPPQLKVEVKVLTLRMEILVGLGEHQKASFIGLSIVETHPHLLGACLLTCECLLKNGDFTRAKQVIDGQIALYPSQPDLWLTLARVEAGLGNTEAAKNAVKEYVKLYPEGKLDVMDIDGIW